MLCVQCNKFECIDLLLEAGADVNAGRQGHLPLHLALIYDVPIAAKLINKGADVNAINGPGDTPLHEVLESLNDPEERAESFRPSFERQCQP